MDICKEKPLKKINLWIISGSVVYDLGKFFYYGRIIELEFEAYISAIMTIFVITLAVGKIKKLFLLIAIYLMICFFDMIIAGAIITGLKMDIEYFMEHILLQEALNISSIFIFLPIAALKRGTSIKRHLNALNGKEVILLIVGVITWGFYIASYQIVLNESGYYLKYGLLSQIANLGGVGIIIGIFVIFFKSNNIKYWIRIQEIQEKLLTEQQVYYEKLLLKENNTRKFRHDINQHLRSIHYFLTEDRVKELSTYIEDLMEELKQIENSTNINTGIDIVNIILADLISKYRKYNIQIEWKGRIPEDIKISLRDLCGLFSNILKNSFEGASQGLKDRYINVTVNAHNERVYICIVNNCKERKKDENKRWVITTKEDKQNHGYGNQIIKEIVEKYKGKIEYTIDHQNFKVEITFINI